MKHTSTNTIRQYPKVPKNIEKGLMTLVDKAVVLLRETDNYKEWLMAHEESELANMTPELYTEYLLDINWKAALDIWQLENIRANKEAHANESTYMTLSAYVQKLQAEHRKKQRVKVTTTSQNVVPRIIEPELNYFRTPRKLIDNQTTPRRKGQTLIDIIAEKNKNNPQKAEADVCHARQQILKGFLPEQVDGIFMSVLKSKIIKAITAHLYAQSKGYENANGQGLPESVVKEFGSDFKPAYGYVYLEPYALTREVLQRDDIGGKDVEMVLAALKEIDDQFYYDAEKLSFNRICTIEKIRTRATSTNEPGFIIVACRQIFWDELENNYAMTPRNELEILKPITTILEMRLYDKLKNLISYNTPTQRKSGYVEISEKTLFDIIAVSKSYDRHRDLINKDFLVACQKLKTMGMIAKTARTQLGKIRFYINPNWNKDAELEESNLAPEMTTAEA